MVSVRKRKQVFLTSIFKSIFKKGLRSTFADCKQIFNFLIVNAGQTQCTLESRRGRMKTEQWQGRAESRRDSGEERQWQEGRLERGR